MYQDLYIIYLIYKVQVSLIQPTVFIKSLLWGSQACINNILLIIMMFEQMLKLYYNSIGFFGVCTSGVIVGENEIC